MIERRLTRTARRTALPVLVGSGRGLRVRTGPSLMRLVSRLELDVEDAFLALLGPGDVVYDVGANIGWYSLLAARRVGPTGKVLAFEPSLMNAAYTQMNAISNGFSAVTAIPAAVGDENGWARFSKSGGLKGRLGDDGVDVVPVLALDSWIAATNTAPPTVLKIDVEGAEASVLRGMSETLRTARPTLIIELHGTNGEVADLLDGAGYEHTPIESDAPTRQAPGWSHIVARPL